MDRKSETVAGRTALVIGHCAGMIDLVALPVWVGMVLIGRMGLEPMRAGGLATLFLISVVAAGLVFAPRLNRIRRRRFVPAAFALAGLAFVGMTATTDYAVLALAHAVAGFAVGCGLSLTHGTMGGSANPHRLMSIAFTALGVVAVVFLGTLPQLVARFGAEALFFAIAAIMFTAALAALLAFPDTGTGGTVAAPRVVEAPLSARVWFGMAGVSLMALNQAMMFAYVERIGDWHGFSAAQVAGVLVAVGVVNLFPAALAGVLERRLSTAGVMVVGPLLQAALGLSITQAPSFAAYAFAACSFIALLIFTHTFVFGFLAREDRSGRAVAATPVMVMTGSAIGPLLGGALAQQAGYGSLGWAAAAIGISGSLIFVRAVRARGAAGSATVVGAKTEAA
jgi:predicted MFS family arabinose efflux permease